MSSILVVIIIVLLWLVSTSNCSVVGCLPPSYPVSIWFLLNCRLSSCEFLANSSLYGASFHPLSSSNGYSEKLHKHIRVYIQDTSLLIYNNIDSDVYIHVLIIYNSAF